MPSVFENTHHVYSTYMGNFSNNYMCMVVAKL